MTVQEYVYAALRKTGMTIEGACAVLGNLQAESAFRPNNVEDRSGISDSDYTAAVDSGKYGKDRFSRDSYGYGLAQWTYYSRKELLWDFAKMQGKSIGDLEMQTEFLIWEMKEYFPNCWAICCKKHDVDLCVYKLLYEWENPAEKDNNYRIRLANAKQWMNLLKDVPVETVTETTAASESESQQATIIQEEPKTDSEGIIIEKTWPPRTLDKKCSGWKEVRLLEALLFCRGYNVLNDGIFAAHLEEKLIEFQRANNLSADGVCGPMTWKALLELPDSY